MNNSLPTWYPWQHNTFKVYTPSFLSTIQANDPFHALYLFISLVNIDLEVKCTRYLSHFIHLPLPPKRKDEKNRNQKKTPKPCDMRCAFEMKEGQKIKLVCSSLIRHTNTRIRARLVYPSYVRDMLRFHLHTVTRCVSGSGFELSGF